jgi:hypothetical protein
MLERSPFAALKKKGKSKDEIVAAKPGAAFDAKWGGGPIDPGFVPPKQISEKTHFGRTSHLNINLTHPPRKTATVFR